MGDLLPGDVIFVRRRSWFGRLLAWAMRRPGEARTYATHCALVTEPGRVIEAHWAVIERSIEACEPDYQVWRASWLMPWQRARLVEEARRYLGRSYGWWHLLPHLGDVALTKFLGREAYAFRRLLGRSRYPICNWIVAWPYREAVGYLFGGVLPAETDPDQLHDYVSRSSRWERVR